MRYDDLELGVSLLYSRPGLVLRIRPRWSDGRLSLKVCSHSVDYLDHQLEQ